MIFSKVFEPERNLKWFTIPSTTVFAQFTVDTIPIKFLVPDLPLFLLKPSKKTEFKPLKMKAVNKNGKKFESIAYNEVSLMRQTHQAAKIQIKINNINRMNELVCDGILVSTAAGSTAYNLSAHGSILPLDSDLLALTPISAFRPRRWKGALLSQKNSIEFIIKNFTERTVSVTADNIEYRDIKSVKINSINENKCIVLFDSNHSMEDKILNEQFEF
mgnify:CR=1 FL=1